MVKSKSSNLQLTEALTRSVLPCMRQVALAETVNANSTELQKPLPQTPFQTHKLPRLLSYVTANPRFRREESLSLRHGNRTVFRSQTSVTLTHLFLTSLKKLFSGMGLT
jgi:hypothetical protein